MSSNPDGQIKDTWHIRKGSTFTTTYQWATETTTTPAPVNITGWVIRSMIRDKYDGDVIASVSTTQGGIVIDDAANGKFTITISAAITAGIEFKKGVFDVELESPSGVVRNLIGGPVVFYQQVTT